MRPVTDNAKISRAKLAYLIDATAAPVCMIAPISSWAAAVSEYAPEGVSGIGMFVQAIPYNFYSLMTFVFIIGLTLTLVHILGIGLTGTSVNPARSFGPALVQAIFGNPDAIKNLWVFIVGPFVGAAIAALVYKLLESGKEEA